MKNSWTDCIKFQRCGCGNCFSVHNLEYGVLISSPAPLSASCALVRFYAEQYNYEICDLSIASRLGVSICLTTYEMSSKWRKELGIDLIKQSYEDSNVK